jgi:hypothetical protein
MDRAVHLIPRRGLAAAADSHARDLAGAAEVLARHGVTRGVEDHRLGVEGVHRLVQCDDRVAGDVAAAGELVVDVAVRAALTELGAA